MEGFVTRLTPAMTRRYVAAGQWPDRLLTDWLDDHGRAAPDRLAIVDSRRSIAYAALAAEVDACARALLALGLRRGDTIALQLPNWIECAVLHLAATRIGVASALITPIHRDREVAHMIRVARARAIFLPAAFRGHDYPAMLARVRAEAPSLETVVVVDGEAPDGALGWRAFLAGAAHVQGSLDAHRPSPDDVIEIVFTSGATGEAKGVLHTSNTLAAPQLQMAKSLRLDGTAVLHIASPITHQTGFLGGVVLPVLIGASIVYQDVWVPERLVEMIERHRIQVSNGSATFLLDLLRAGNLDRHDLSSFRIFRCGGGPIPAPLVREARERLPHTTILRGWGQSENGVVTMTRLGDPEEKIVETDGCAQPGMEVRVVDDRDRPVPAGTEGRLQCRGPFQFVGYAGRPDLTEQSHVAGDWFDTGDLAAMDAEGYIRITGRVKDIIIRGGEKIPAKYVEDLLYEDERVLDAAIVGMPDARLGERACAFVICRKGRTLSLPEVQRFLESRGVARQYWPERLEVVDSMPRTANGKVRKADLRAAIAGTPAEGRG